MSFKALIKRLNEIKNYLEKIINQTIPTNPQIIYNIQEIFNYLPNFDTESVIKAMSIQTNNNYLVLYLSWITKTIVALHKLINNKIMLKEEEKQPEKKDNKKDEKDKEKDNKDKTEKEEEDKIKKEEKK
jgi:26S proteasome regulatory subunit N8